jgi:hypothetical protein
VEGWVGGVEGKKKKQRREVRRRGVPRIGSVVERRSGGRVSRCWCSQEIADSSDKGQALTVVELGVPLSGLSVVTSGDDNADDDSAEIASLMLTISMMPRSTSWK